MKAEPLEQYVAIAAVLAVTAFWVRHRRLQFFLVPLDDAQAASPMLRRKSAGILQIFGDYAYVWTLDDSICHQYHGNFSLHFGDRRM